MNPSLTDTNNFTSEFQVQQKAEDLEILGSYFVIHDLTGTHDVTQMISQQF